MSGLEAICGDALVIVDSLDAVRGSSQFLKGLASAIALPLEGGGGCRRLAAPLPSVESRPIRTSAPRTGCLAEGGQPEVICVEPGDRSRKMPAAA